jgi:phage terminase small subunit
MAEARPPMNFPPDWSDFGPKMLALGERERRFVWAFLLNAMTDGRENGAQAARDAGYSDVKEGAKVRAHGLLHRNDVLDAMQEVAGRELRGLAIPAVLALGKLVQKTEHPDHRKSLEMVLNRTGQHERTQLDVNHTVTRKVDASEAMAKIAEFREKFPLQFAKMIGAAPPVIETEFSEVADVDQA